MEGLKVSLSKDKSKLTIEMPFDGTGRLSKTGNTILVATTHGAVEATDVKINGQNLRVNVNCYVYAKTKEEKKAERAQAAAATTTTE